MEEIKFSLGVFGCIFNKDFSQVLLVKRNQEKRNKHKADWGNVGGKVEFREMSTDACLREIQEEVGLSLNKDSLKLIKIKELPNLHKNWHGIQFVYAASIDEESKIVINEESDSFEWFSLDNLPDKMLDSKEEILEIAERAKKQSF